MARRCVAHGAVELFDLWYYRDTDHGPEYLCADAYAQLNHEERRAWQFVPADVR